MATIKACVNRNRNAEKSYRKIKMRAHLNADSLFAHIRQDFAIIPDHRAGNIQVPLVDALMSGFAMFSLKDPSLLSFDERRQEDPDSYIPCDSQMRTILDPIHPSTLRKPFRTVFAQLQRGKAMEKMTWLAGHFLLAEDGTGIFSSETVSFEYCLKKRKRNGKVEYYQQMLAGAFVHPDRREVIPTCLEMIIKQDGATKGDGERNAAKRYFEDLRREHLHLKIIVTEDALRANAPHIKELTHHGLRYILGVKAGDHAFLFAFIDEAVERGDVTEFLMHDPEKPEIAHYFCFKNDVPFNKSSEEELRVNFLEYWEVDGEGNVKKPVQLGDRY